MKRTRAMFLALLVAVLGASSAAQAYTSVGVSFFHDQLSPYGRWTVSASYGDVWRPSVSAGWRPYTNGQWVYTDYGWTFVSDENWGWATYHYGRWYFDPVYGWVWVPDTEWGPSWTAFYEGDGWIGWAPLPPGVGINVGWRSRAIDPRAFCFVEERSFLDPRIGSRIAPIDRNAYLLRRTANMTRFSVVSGRVINRGVPVERIARATGRPIAPRRVVTGADQRNRIGATEVAMFRPRVSRQASRPPSVANSDSRAQFHGASASNRQGARVSVQSRGEAHTMAARARENVALRASVRRARPVAPPARPRVVHPARALAPARPVLHERTAPRVQPQVRRTPPAAATRGAVHGHGRVQPGPRRAAMKNNRPQHARHPDRGGR